MKRASNLFPQILEWDNLRNATWRAAKGKRHRSEVVAFQADCDAHLHRIQEQLADHSFPFARYTQFPIRDPKPRIITAPGFPQRVVHHAVVRVCESYFERFLIDETYACRQKKGRIAAMDRAHRFSRQFRWYLKMDIRSFFASVSHEILLERLARRFKDKDLLRLFEQIVHSYNPRAGIALPIGSLTSQHFANFYLGWLDHHVKHGLHERGYVRYMDDFVVWANTRHHLVATLDNLESFLTNDLQLAIKATPVIQRTRQGMNYLGCQIFPSHVCLNRRNRNRVSAEISRLQSRLSDNDGSHIRDQARLTALWNFSTCATTVDLRFDSFHG
jgi:RNA-directed DNA polymerase